MFLPFLIGTVVASTIVLVMLLANRKPQPEIMAGAVPVVRTALVALAVIVSLIALSFA